MYLNLLSASYDHHGFNKCRRDKSKYLYAAIQVKKFVVIIKSFNYITHVYHKLLIPLDTDY